MVNMKPKDRKTTLGSYVTIPQLANLLGVSRIAVYRRVKKGEIPATRIGAMYVISDTTLESILGRKTSKVSRNQIETAVREAVKEYGEVLKKLGKE